MKASIFANETGLEIHVEDQDYNMGVGFIGWDEVAKYLAPYLPLPPAPTTGDDQ